MQYSKMKRETISKLDYGDSDEQETPQQVQEPQQL